MRTRCRRSANGTPGRSTSSGPTGTRRFDLRLEVEGGHLYRRGSFGLFTEAVAIADRVAAQADPKEYTEEVTLRIGPVDKRTTGYQMAVSLPDRQAQDWLTDFYGSVLNGGAVCDQKGMDFGNESDGWYYGGSCWMNALALAAGVPAAGQLAAHPYGAERGVSGQGRAHPQRLGRPRRSAPTATTRAACGWTTSWG